jgi:hypothetical protein
MKMKKAAHAKAANNKTGIKPIVSENDFYASALSAIKAEAVENGSARLSVFYTDGKPTAFTTGHSKSRRAGGRDGN